MKPNTRILLALVGLGIIAAFTFSRLPYWNSRVQEPPPPPQGTPEDVPAKAQGKPMLGKKIELPPPPDEAEKKRMMETVAVFYGKVIDQHGDAVPNADVQYTRRAISQDEVRTLIPIWWTKTDSDGRFTIRQPHAPTLRISVGSPPGYYTVGDTNGEYHFYQRPEAVLAIMRKDPRIRMPSLHVADPNNPIIFKLKKMGQTEPMIYREKSAVVKAEQDFLIGANRSHTLRLKYWLNPNAKRIESPQGRVIYDWGFELSIAGGGLVPRTDSKSTEASSFIAPETGYTPKITNAYNINMDFSENTSLVKREYFARFADGTHARIAVDLRSEPQRPWVNLESWFNPAPGSRATEFESSKQIEAPPTR